MLCSVLALIAAAAGLTLSLHYPIGPVFAVGAFVAGCIVFFIWPASWLLVLPGLLPVIGFAPWTGWITFEELDILILTVGAGGYANLAWHAMVNGTQRAGRPRGPPVSALVWLLVALFAISTVTSMFRGFSDAGGWSFGWFQGYHEPMNSLRLTKSFFEALLVVALWRAAHRQDPEHARNLLVQGLMLGLAGAALATMWERAAFTDLMDFSADYRTTALFWEMHVGGAALDGFLALTVPFALREFLTARDPRRWGLAVIVLGLAAYACLTTFSRGVYLSLPTGALVFWGLHTWQQKSSHAAMANTDAPGGSRRFALIAAVLVVAGFGLGASWVFQTSGYRGMAALLTTVAAMLPLARILRGFGLRQWLVGVAVCAELLLLAFAIQWLVPKGAYVAWGLAFVFTATMLVLLHGDKRPSLLKGAMAFAGFVATAAGILLVANHWGENLGLLHAAPVVLVVLGTAIVAGISPRPLWPDAVRWQATTVGAMCLVAAIIGILGGGDYMTGRFSTGGQDFEGRLQHWRIGRDMLDSRADWMLGKGLGRFPANYFMTGNPTEHTGDYRLKQENGNTYLTLTGGLHINGWGEIFRVTQRVVEPGKSAIVTARVRTEKGAGLHFEVCEKHLLYSRGCVIKTTGFKGAPGVWQTVRLELEGSSVTRGPWYAPRLLAFSMSVESIGGVADLDDVTLTTSDGRPLLVNGDFTDGMAHWFFSSDRMHLPWHIKNVFMNVLFDQGIVGATLLCLLLLGAMWRTGVGAARGHPLAPALAASLTGFVVVGLFDSLLDVPRVAWLFYLLLLMALTLRGRTRLPRVSRGAPALAALVMATAGCWIGFQSDQVQAAETNAARQVIQVGPGREIKTLAQASKIARAGALVEVDSGEYLGDVAVWTQDQLTVRATGGRVKLRAAGVSAEGKAIWVVRANGMRVEGFDFEGAKVPDRNGAGIRLERGSLFVSDCSFMYNEMGLLTSNDPTVELEVVNSEFAHNQRPDGHNHNLYAGQIARLSVTGSYFHHAHIGHLLKSRAAVNRIFYNRLTDEAGGTASYELEFPNGGVAYVVGNLIQQNPQTENPHLISFGAEGYKWPRNEIYLVNNTLVNPLPQGGVFLRVASGADVLRAINNLLVGAGALESAGPGDYRNNFTVEPQDFAQASTYDYRLASGSPLAGNATDPGAANGQRLQMQREYQHPRGTRPLDGSAHNPGAMQRMAAPSFP